MTAKQQHAAIVIVNYRTADLAVDCLRSLAGEVAAAPGTEVLIVDNASGDGSAAVIARAIEAEGWAGWARPMPLDRNGGFAAGNNAAIAHLLAQGDPPDYVWLLNPDTVVRPGAMQALVSVMQADARVGICGSRLEGQDGVAQVSAFRFPGMISELLSGLRLGLAFRLLGRYAVPVPPAELPHAADWVSGASMLVRREVFESVGLMDDGYFLYYEEVDFCLRARRAGWHCWHVPGSRAVHLVGQATGFAAAKQRVTRRPRYWFDSRRRFFSKNYGLLRTVIADLLWMAAFATFRIRAMIQRKHTDDPPWLLWDFTRHSVASLFRGK